MNYYIGDLHFGCTNKYENRTLETDKLIIENWNRIVHQNDDVYLIGDIGRFGGNKDNEYLCQCLSVLKGRKHWILGNHDNTKDARINQLFAEICDYKEISDSFDGKSYKLVLSHYPIYAWHGQNRGTILLHGQCHDNFDNALFQKAIKELNEAYKERDGDKYVEFKAINVGCMLDYMNYRPRTLKEILENN